MPVKWIEDGEQSGWLVTAGPKGNQSRRLFVARKHGGKEACHQVAKDYEPHLQALLADRPAPAGDTRLAASIVAIAAEARTRIRRLFSRGGA